MLKHDYFKKRTYQSNINDVLRLSLLIGIEADTSGPTYKKACNIAARLQPFFDDKVDAEDLFNSIEEAGGLKRLSRSNNICEEDQTCDDDDDGFSTPQDGISTSSFPQPRSPSGLVTPPGNPLPPNHRTKRISHGRPSYQAKFEVDEFNGLATEDDKIILEVVVDQHMLREILNSPYGSRTRIIVEHHKSAPGWENIEAISANVID